MQTVVLFGDINIDVLMSIGPYPEPGGDAMANQVTLRPGGSVANTAIVLGKLDVEPKMIGCTGEDLWGDLALESLVSSGVNVDFVSKSPIHTTGLIFIPVTPDGERTMFSYRGANLRVRPSEITPKIYEDTRFLHISGYNFLESPQKEATWRAVELAKDRGTAISLDTGVEPSHHAKQALISILPELSLLVLGMQEAGALLGVKTIEHAVEGFLARGVTTIAIKLGREGCFLATAEGSHLLPGFPMKTVDTTGAGDAFCGGMLYGLLNGLSLGACGSLANLLGGLATTVWGAGPALPGADEVLDYLRTQEKIFTRSEINDWEAEILRSL